ncbi:protein SSX3-like protein, partial [Cricetulus griseus]
TGSIQAFLQDRIPSAMNRRRSCSVNVKKTEHNPEKTCKAFEDISKYFSKEEWAKMSYSEKSTHVYMERNYTTMTRLERNESKLSVWSHRLRERKKPVIYEEISDPEEEDEDEEEKGWTCARCKFCEAGDSGCMFPNTQLSCHEGVTQYRTDVMS